MDESFGISQIDSCQSLEVEGESYVLTQDLISTGTCFSISRTANISLDCGNHMIIGDGSGNGIFISDSENFILKNCNLSNFKTGIFLTASNNGLVEGNMLKQNNEGLYLDSGGNLIKGNLAEKNTRSGIVLDLAYSNELSQNVSVNNGENGIFVDGSFHNLLLDNHVSSNEKNGIELRGSENTTMKRNIVTENLSDGFFIGPFSINNILENNESSRNLGFGFNDDSDLNNEENSNSYLNNFCISNGQGGSDPKGLCDTPIVRFIGIEADQPKERFPIIFRCLDSTFVNVSVKGKLLFEFPDFEPGNKIKAPGGTNLVNIQYDDKLNKIETMNFYKNQKLLGIHIPLHDQSDVNLFGKVQNWGCADEEGSFPKNSKEVEIAIGSFRE